MSQPMEECDHCHKMLPQSKIATHFGYCRRNIKKCQQCGQMYDINSQEEHEEEFHSKEKCNYCNKEFPKNDISKHKNSCTHKPKFCQYCQQSVPVNQYSQHFKICEARTKICEKCRKDIKNKDFLIHLTICPGFIQQPKPKQRQRQALRTNKAEQYYKRQDNAQNRGEYQRVKLNSQQEKDVLGSKKEFPIKKQYEVKPITNKNYAPISYEHHSINNNNGRATNQPNNREQLNAKRHINSKEVNKVISNGVIRQRAQFQAPKVKISDNKHWQVNYGSKKTIVEQNPGRKQQVKYNYDQFKGKQRILNYLDDKPVKLDSRPPQYTQQQEADKNRNQAYLKQGQKYGGNHYEREVRQVKQDMHKIVTTKPTPINQQLIRKVEQKPKYLQSQAISQNKKVYSQAVSNKEHNSRNDLPLRQEKYYRKQENLGQHNDLIEGEDPELQKAIMMSMGVTNENKYRQANRNTKPSKSYKNEMDLAKQFGDVDMNSSFYRDLQMQEVYEQQIRKNNRR